jgi:hypothetical protein
MLNKSLTTGQVDLFTTKMKRKDSISTRADG